MEDPERNPPHRGWVRRKHPHAPVRSVSSLLLSSCVVTVAYIPGGCYDYITLSGKEHVERLSRDWPDTNVLSHVQVTPPAGPSCPCEFVLDDGVLASLQEESGVNPGARVINSVLEGDVAVATGAVLQHCHLKVSRPSFYR